MNITNRLRTANMNAKKKPDYTKLGIDVMEHAVWTYLHNTLLYNIDNKVHEANMGPICGRLDPGGPHVGPMKFTIWEK